MMILFPVRLSAQENSTSLQHNNELRLQMAQLKNEVAGLRLQLSNQKQETGSSNRGYAAIGLVLFLCGVFCALWAQDSGRRPWFWFVLGFIFPIFSMIALLIKNSEDIRKEL